MVREKPPTPEVKRGRRGELPGPACRSAARMEAAPGRRTRLADAEVFRIMSFCLPQDLLHPLRRARDPVRTKVGGGGAERPPARSPGAEVAGAKAQPVVWREHRGPMSSVARRRSACDVNECQVDRRGQQQSGEERGGQGANPSSGDTGEVTSTTPTTVEKAVAVSAALWLSSRSALGGCRSCEALTSEGGASLLEQVSPNAGSTASAESTSSLLRLAAARTGEDRDAATSGRVPAGSRRGGPHVVGRGRSARREGTGSRPGAATVSGAGLRETGPRRTGPSRPARPAHARERAAGTTAARGGAGTDRTSGAPSRGRRPLDAGPGHRR